MFYFKNYYTRSKGDTSLYTLTFSIKFPTTGPLWIAYHYPYSYTRLQTYLQEKVCDKETDRSWFFHRSLLCRTLAGNRCDLLTVTSMAREDLELFPLSKRPYVVFSARVHPGESNASWVMEGAYLCFLLFFLFLFFCCCCFSSFRVLLLFGNIPLFLLFFSFEWLRSLSISLLVQPLCFLTAVHALLGLLDRILGNSIEAYFLRQRFIFKIVPMLNPDGVRPY